ncbi:TorF family putative porin [Pseudoduganella sp. OTU4001]|uniref:TorF family putative porin n=1 Tax=Pseudoduganella sp. OTU4001 TaxID=3043854 RepID=UPI00313EF158
MNQKSKNLVLTAAVAVAMATMGTGLAHAADAAPEAKPDNEISFNAALTSDYRYRAISQTRLKPALQGGADWVNNPTGFYAGVWGSTIKWIKDGGGDASVEIDVYGGKRGEIAPGVSYDVGFLAYVYPSNDLNPSANTREVYGQLGYGSATLKYSHSLSNLFGFADSKHSTYLDASVNQDLGEGFVLNLHVGHQKVKNSGAFSYTDWKVGVTKDLGVASVSLAYIDTNNDNYLSPVNGKNLGKAGLVLTVSKTF